MLILQPIWLSRMLSAFLWALLLQAPIEADDPVVEDFTLVDVDGQSVSLSKTSQDGLVVLVFLGAECPTSKRYAPKLRQLFENYKDRGVTFLAISSNQQDSLSEFLRFTRDYGISFPSLRDTGSRVADQLSADRTPEVFLIDRERRLRYRGRIDDQFDAKEVRLAPRRFDLEVALEEVLSGRPVRVKRTPAFGCRLGRARAEGTDTTVTWSNRIASIFRERCNQCHRVGGSAPFPLSRYEDIAGWADTIREVVDQKRMPPWFAEMPEGTYANGSQLSAEESHAIRHWLDAGTPLGEGDPGEVANPANLLATEPDLSFAMADQEIEIPAEGAVDYQYYLVESRLENKVLVRALEVRPANRTAVRHVSVFAIPRELARIYPSARELLRKPEALSNLIAWYSPDGCASVYPSDAARELPAGCSFAFRIYCRPTGRVEREKTTLALWLANPNQVMRKVRTIPLSVMDITPIEGQTNRSSSVNRTLEADLQILSVIPDLTVSGRSFVITGSASDANARTLLNVPEYHFYWQPQYRFREPVPFLRGSTLECSATFHHPLVDPNSDALIADPVVSEDQMVGYFEVVPPPMDPVAAQAIALADPTRNISTAIAGLATTLLFCLVFLWLKPTQRPVPPPIAPVATSSPTE